MRSTYKWRSGLLGVVLTAALGLGAGTALAQQTRISISTGGTGGVWYPMGGAMANVLSKKLPNTSATAEVTGASVDNLNLLSNQKTDVGFSMVDSAWEAVNGTGKFSGRKVPVQTLAVIHPLIMHVVTLDDSPIKSIADMKGKRISTGSPGSGSEVMAFRILKAKGIDPMKDITRERLSVAEAANALRDRKIDAFFHAAGIPIPAVTDIANSPGLKIRMLDHGDAVEIMKKEAGPIYAATAIPAGTYKGVDRPTNSASVWGTLLVNQSMSEAMAYNIVKTLFDNQPDLVAAHREATNMTLANQSVSKAAIPFHAGAVKYFSEKGVSLK
jgi:uncharacterized protein